MFHISEKYFCYKDLNVLSFYACKLTTFTGSKGSVHLIWDKVFSIGKYSDTALFVKTKNKTCTQIQK